MPSWLVTLGKQKGQRSPWGRVLGTGPLGSKHQAEHPQGTSEHPPRALWPNRDSRPQLPPALTCQRPALSPQPQAPHTGCGRDTAFCSGSFWPLMAEGSEGPQQVTVRGCN